MFSSFSLVCASERAPLWAHFINHLWEIYQIYNAGTFGDKDELFTFWGQKIKGQGHSETEYGQNPFCGYSQTEEH